MHVAQRVELVRRKRITERSARLLVQGGRPDAAIAAQTLVEYLSLCARHHRAAFVVPSGVLARGALVAAVAAVALVIIFFKSSKI